MINDKLQIHWSLRETKTFVNNKNYRSIFVCKTKENISKHSLTQIFALIAHSHHHPSLLCRASSPLAPHSSLHTFDATNSATRAHFGNRRCRSRRHFRGCRRLSPLLLHVCRKVAEGAARKQTRRLSQRRLLAQRAHSLRTRKARSHRSHLRTQNRRIKMAPRSSSPLDSALSKWYLALLKLRSCWQLVLLPMLLIVLHLT